MTTESNQVRPVAELLCEPVLKPDEMAAVLKISRSALDKMVDGPPSIDLAGKKYVLAVVLDWLEDRAQRPAPAMPERPSPVRHRTSRNDRPMELAS